MTNTQTQAPLTRRQAREIERRTGVRPIAVAPAAPAEHIQLAEASAAAIRHDTGFIERNDVAELRSVVPTEVFDREELSSFANRGLTIRAQKPAALVAKQRRRNVVTVAAAASVAAVASTGLLVPLAQGQSNEAHQADLAAAAKAQDAEAADVVAAKPEVERVVTEVVEAPVEAFDRTDVASFDSEVEAATVTQAATTTNNTQASNGNSSSQASSTANYSSPVYAVDGNPYPEGQCTWWAFQRRAALGLGLSGAWGDAYQWASQAAADGYVVDSNPTFGAVAASSAGHVAVVEHVVPGVSVEISEANYAGHFPGQHRVMSWSKAMDYLYIH